jgi:hypothetical protein
MLFRLGEFALRTGATLAVACLLLVPTGMCVCGHGEDATPEEHQPGCPEVRKLDRSAAPAHYAGDQTPAPPPVARDADCPAGPPRLVREVGHAPPRGHPLYLTLQTLRI